MQVSTFFCQLIVGRVLKAADCFSVIDDDAALARHGLTAVLQMTMLQQLLPEITEGGNVHLNRPSRVRYLAPAGYLMPVWAAYMGCIALVPVPVTQVTPRDH